MKYWLLTTEYPPFYGGGIGTYCFHTANMLAAEGHDVTVFVNDSSIHDIRIEINNGVRIIRFQPARTKTARFLGHLTHLSYEFSAVLKEFVEKEGVPDIIESQEYLGIAYYLLQNKKLGYEWCAKIPIVITMHSPSFLYMEYNHVPIHRYPNYWICEMERFCLQAADKIISPSQFMIDELSSRFELNNKNISIVRNPFPVGKEAIEPATGNEIVFYGKLTAQKGAFELLSYFKDLWDNGFDRPLHLLGGQDIVYHPAGLTMGDLIRRDYKDYIDKELLLFGNRIAPEQRAARLSSAEVVIVPSMNDNLPYVVLEMMALGKIVLASKQGGHAEIIENAINGFIFDHKQPASFASQLKIILALGHEERLRIAEAAVQKIKDTFNYKVIYDQKMAFLQSSSVAESHLLFPFIRNSEKTPPATGKNKPDNQKLSIVIPYYNMGRYIDETIDSIKQSEYTIQEIIIVNDGSNNQNDIRLLDKYRNKPGFVVVDTINRGVAAARNTGARIASGKYLAFLDADDRVHPTYYKKAVRVLNRYSNVHFVGCWTKYFGASTASWPTFAPEAPLILYHNLVNSSGLVYRTSSFLDNGGNDSSMTFQGLEDYESVVSMVASGYSGVVLPELLFDYRVRRDSMIRKITGDKKQLLTAHIREKHQWIYKKYESDLEAFEEANGPGILIDNPSLDYHLADKLPFGKTISLALIGMIKRNRHIKPLAYKVYRLIK